MQVVSSQGRQLAAAAEAGGPGGLVLGQNFGLDGLEAQGPDLERVALAPPQPLS